MFKKAALALAALIALTSVFATGCGGGGVVSTAIQMNDENTSLSAEDKTLTLDLNGIPSTGYEWTCEAADENVLKETSQELEDNRSDESELLVGTPFTWHYVYEAAGDGETTLTAKYARSWEANPDDLEYIYDVTVKDGKITDVTLRSAPVADISLADES